MTTSMAILPENVNPTNKKHFGVVSNEILYIACGGISFSDIDNFITRTVKRISTALNIPNPIYKTTLTKDKSGNIIYCLIYFKDIRILNAYFNMDENYQPFTVKSSGTVRYVDYNQADSFVKQFTCGCEGSCVCGMEQKIVRNLYYGCLPTCNDECKGLCNGQTLNWGDIPLYTEETIKIPMKYILEGETFQYEISDQYLRGLDFDAKNEPDAKKRESKMKRVKKIQTMQILRYFYLPLRDGETKNVLIVSPSERDQSFPRWVDDKYIKNLFSFYASKNNEVNINYYGQKLKGTYPFTYFDNGSYHIIFNSASNDASDALVMLKDKPFKSQFGEVKIFLRHTRDNRKT
jgi:hypothetical protein